MKIRYGFVSNSSSSSFIIEQGHRYPTSFSLAKHMLEIRNADGNGWEDSKEIEKITKAETKRLDTNHAVTFNSCNYETYITPSGNKFYVSTCNNTDWEDIEDKLDWGGGHDNGDYRELEGKTEFWYIEEGIIGRPLGYDELNKLKKEGIIPDNSCNRDKHWGEYVMLDGKPICNKCWSIANPGKDMFLDKVIVMVKPEYIPKKGLKLR